ncbi:MAG: ATP-binding protein [Chloroflexi bacterium]|nr:ATP-binding protein [Chloroflexota bacterium]
MQKFQVMPVIGHRNKVVVLGATSSDQRMMLGRLAEVGPYKNIDMDIGKEHVIAIVGKRGSGKTHSLGVVLEGLISTSELVSKHASDKAVLVLDTLNLFQWIGVPLDLAQGKIAKEQLDRARHWGLAATPLPVKLWHLAGSLPMTTKDSSPFLIQVSDMSAQDWGFLFDVDVMMDPMGQLVMSACDKVRHAGWSSNSGHRNPMPNHSIRHLVNCIGEDKELGNDFSPETRRAVRQRLISYEHVGLFSTKGTPIKDLLQPNQASVLLLGRCPEDLRTVVAFLLMRKLRELRSIASERKKELLITGSAQAVGDAYVPPTWVLIDEAQNIIPSKTVSLANQELTRFVREGRNFGLSMVISTQQPQAIDPKVMSQVDIIVVHTLTVQTDISYIMNNLKSAPPENIVLGRQPLKLQEAIRELEVGQCLISATESPRGLFAEIRPRITAHGGFEA